MELRWDNASKSSENMAIDSLMLEQAELGFSQVRLYKWSEPWITIGRNQDPSQDIVPGILPYSVRPTGGKAVLHGHDITYSIAVSLPSLGTDQRNLKSCYRRLTGPLIKAMNDCLLGVALAEDTGFLQKREQMANCFEQTSPYDIIETKTGQKVCGCALRVTDKAILMQTSIPFESPRIDQSLIFGESKHPKGLSWDPSVFPELLSAHLQDSLDVTICV